MQESIKGSAAAAGSAWFGVQVVDEATGRGIPLVEFETVNHLLFVTDSNGWAAIAEPGLMGNETFFHIRSHGYTFPRDGFGYAGARLRVTPGGRAVVKMKRVNIAERLCRLTGGGIYADSLLLGEQRAAAAVPLRDPAISGGVLGQDSALALRYRGKMFWFWGDTNRAAYPLGNFRMSGAIATFPKGRKSAEAGLDFAYFTNSDGFAREMCPSPKPGPIWIFGLVVLKPGSRDESLWGHYSRMKDLGTRVEHGYVRWNDARDVFEIAQELPPGETWRFLDGHPIRFDEDNKTYFAGGFCFPTVRVPADDSRRLTEPAAYEAFTCLTSRGDIKRDARGAVVYDWQKDAPPITSEREGELAKQGKLKADEARFLPRDSAGNPVVTHAGSVTWNPWRKKWLLIATERFGKASLLGEIIYSEADYPTGPWRRAVRIITHDKYTFYNPVHHPFLDAAGGRIVHFEGTYTEQFSGNPRPTPRYDYNQILYRLDLADPRLKAA